MNPKRILLFLVPILMIAACAPVQKEITTIPGPGEEVKQPAEKATVQKQEISAEVKELLGKSNAKVSSIYYKYRGPETGTNFHEFYVKGSKIRYKPYRELKSLDKPESYDSIFIDKAAKTAQSYCTEAYCSYKGKKADLNYDEAYIKTIFDWVDVKEAKKIGEEVIDDRSTWKLETSNGILWVDTFYGIPLKVESSGKTYKFEQISVNSVKESDVSP